MNVFDSVQNDLKKFLHKRSFQLVKHSNYLENYIITFFIHTNLFSHTLEPGDEAKCMAVVNNGIIYIYNTQNC